MVRRVPQATWIPAERQIIRHYPASGAGFVPAIWFTIQRHETAIELDAHLTIDPFPE
jgi:hypothetical protein